MSKSPGFPLLAKVLAWLCMHLLFLGLFFLGFVGWQLGLGLDSLLSGSAGERLRDFGEIAREKISNLPPGQWNSVIQPLGDARNVTAAVYDATNQRSFPKPIPGNVLARIMTTMPPFPNAGPPDRRPPYDGPAGPPPRRESETFDGPDPFDRRDPMAGFDDPAPRPRSDGFPPDAGAGKLPSFVPQTRPLFLLRGKDGDGYWAGVQLHFAGSKEPRRPCLLLIRSDRLDGSGMFFDVKPWLWGGIAVFLLSLAFWTPFVLGITRYLHRLTGATERIASGHFQVSLPHRGNDELGNLGRTIESMATRLDHLVSGQKRFLGDAAHELCAPIARLRTGLGILEMKLGNADTDILASIDADAGELAALVEEILAFSRTGSRAPRCQMILLERLVSEVISREAGGLRTEVDIPPDLTVSADPALLGRAVGNLMRNAAVHAGPQAKVSVHAMETHAAVLLTISDDGPGVPTTELARIFEPFYRPDRSRSRDTGGCGLGLAIVRSAIEACGGKTTASLPDKGGFAVTISLLKQVSDPREANHIDRK